MQSFNQIFDKLPESVDYSQNGMSTPVKNQGKCGSCWAFTSVEMLETYMAINSNKLIELSPEQLVRCAKNFLQCGGTGGCKGAVP